MDKEYHPCDECGMNCDGWEAQYCCELCKWQYSDLDDDWEYYCNECDPSEI